MAMKAKKYLTGDQVVALYRYVKDHHNYQDAAKQFGVDQSTVSTWVMQVDHRLAGGHVKRSRGKTALEYAVIILRKEKEELTHPSHELGGGGGEMRLEPANPASELSSKVLKEQIDETWRQLQYLVSQHAKALAKEATAELREKYGKTKSLFD